MSFNLRVFQGVTLEQVRDVMNYKAKLKTDEEVEGIRLTREEQKRFSSPVLLGVVIHNDDERKSDPIQ